MAENKYIPYAITDDGNMIQTKTIFSSEQECFDWFDKIERDNNVHIKSAMIDCHFADHSKKLIGYEKTWNQKVVLSSIDGYNPS